MTPEQIEIKRLKIEQDQLTLKYLSDLRKIKKQIWALRRKNKHEQRTED